MSFSYAKYWSACVLPLAAALFSVPAYSGVVIDGTRVIYPADSREVTVKLTNTGKRPVLVQSWLDNGDSKATPDKIVTPFVLTPPINRVEPGKGQSLRISATNVSALRQDRESVWWLNVLEIPAKPETKDTEPDNYLQLAVRSRIKLFYRPAALKKYNPSEMVRQLAWDQGSNGLTVKNPTPFHYSLSSITVAGKKVEAGMVPPLENRTYSSIRAVPGNIITVTWIDDYGASREQEYTVK
ncbi:fimbria/pilus periplasmic chaperone [Citrobacter sp. Cs237]|uniref:fimbrial biogenesis chaperone n=1 Tax=Citrobacter TaxID=544 RepID=UPI00257654C8|nr:fimbria/pilus periplasmic chaperone [Citrobacter sp. Cs237]MDM2749284.1 fimbria/pilus periplasmic chaperone [Citrobacter sp. Cs237]HBU8850345.1 fimbria/pilus periplasmic chaperone [Citrobacter sedlakii]